MRLGNVARNVLASCGTHASNVVIGFFLARYTLDVLGKSTYGSWLLINSIASYGGLLYFGMGETIARFIAKYESEQNWHRMNQVMSLGLAMYSALGTLAFIIATILALTAGYWGEWTGDDLFQAQLTIMILGVNVVVGMTGSVFGGVLHGMRRFDLERGIGFGFDLLRMVLFVTFLGDKYGLVTIALIYFIVTLGENLFYLILAKRLLPTLSVSPSLLDHSILKECFQFSSMAFLNSLSGQLINATDTITIGLMMGKEAIVPYYFGLRLSQFAKQPIEKIAHIAMPTAGALQGENDKPRRNRFLVKTLGIVFLLVSGVVIGGAFFGGDILRLWVGSGPTAKVSAEELNMSYRILVILMATQLIALPCSILRAFLFSGGHVKVAAAIYLSEAIANLALSIVLCHFFGLEGVAWGTAIPVAVIEMCILLPYALNRLEVSLWRILREGLGPQLFPLTALLGYSILMASFARVHQDWAALILVAVCGAGTLGLSLWLRQRFSKAFTVA